ncbi:hypothetical protein GIB67_027800 [Kingdonia uniflora]|uniref:SWIM-type domain-containing protein n=1 Tax=Kingdonia uniflora TaxID=39325 RepID=A0A7J7PCG7_9MAGN|nr:hypothetical protein GIB67_027800 [Kingdonia uniflora]
MNGVQLYTIVHFSGDIVRPKIGSIVTYVGGSTKLTSLRAYSSYEDFATLLEETNEIRREDWLSTTKDTGSGRGLSTTKVGGPLQHNSFPDPEPEYRGYPETNGRGVDPRSIPQSNVHLSNEPVLTNVPQSNEPFQTIPTNVPLSNEPSIPQSSIHLSNELVLANVPPSNEPMLNNVPFSIKPEAIIGQTEPSAEFQFEPQPEQVKDLMDFQFKFAAYTKDPYDFSKEFNIGDLYRDRIKLKNHIRAYAVVNKFNLEHVLSNEYKIVLSARIPTTYEPLCGSEQHFTTLESTRIAFRMAAEPLTNIDFDKHMNAIRNTDPVGLQYILGIPKETWSNLYIPMNRYGVAYTNHVESWNNVILKVKDLHIHVFIEELCRICSEMSYTYKEEVEKSQARLTPWATDQPEKRKTDSVNIEDGSCSCRWWQTMGIPCKHEVRALGLANVDPTTRVSEYYTNNTYKAVYEPIWIPIRGIEQWKILKTDPRVRASIPIVRADHPRTQRKRRVKIPGLVTKLRFCSRCRKNGHNRRSCKLLPIRSDDNTRPTMAPSFTMSTEPPIIPDEDVVISLY